MWRGGGGGLLLQGSCRIPTGCGGQLQGGLCVAVLTATHCGALHVGPSVQQQLQGTGQDRGQDTSAWRGVAGMRQRRLWETGLWFPPGMWPRPSSPGQLRNLNSGT